VALYHRTAVRRAAVDRYLLLTAKFAAVAHVGTDRQTDGHSTVLQTLLPLYLSLLPQESKQIDEFQNSIGASELHSLCYFLLNILLSPGLMGA